MSDPVITACVPCKVIIDQGAATVQVLTCLNATILLHAPLGVTPTKEMEEEFQDAANKLAAVASKIERCLRTGATLNG